ncbi:MAG: PTS sugar transporter subunit IIA [Fibrobacterota bacterium]|nr:PTS sugar transporter subunit IIA [Fibrobacterota bacterium]QQS05547.1 MAG: PTS sugar transporter subunit IIA [Fibrobacterota bacterium]
MRLSDHIAESTVFLSGARGRDAILPLLVNGICHEWKEGDPAVFLERTWEREKQGATAVGLGVSIPHLRCQTLSDLRIAVAVNPEGSDFPSPDGLPIRIVFLLASPPSKAGSHVRALAAVARLDAATVDDLVLSKDASEFLERLRRWEDRLEARA